MRNIFHHLSTYNISLALTLGLFTTTFAIKPAYCQDIDLNDIALAVRLGKLFDSAKKNLKKKDFKALLKDTLNLQEEVEYLTGKRIDLEKCIDHAFYEAKKKSKYKLDSKIEKEVKKIIKNKGKGYDHKIKIMNDDFDLDVDFDSLEGQTYLSSENEIFQFFMEKPKDKHGNEIKEIVIPLSILIGITSTLAGVLVGIVPIQVPRKAEVVTFLVSTGIGYIVEGIKEVAENQRKEEEKLREL